MHVPYASAAGQASAAALPWRAARRMPARIPVWRPDQSGCATASSVRECGSALGVQRRISSRPVAIPGAIKVSTRPGPRGLGCSPQWRDVGGLLPLASSPTSERVRRCGPELPYKRSDTRRCHHVQLQHRGHVVQGGPLLSQFSRLSRRPGTWPRGRGSGRKRCRTRARRGGRVYPLACLVAIAVCAFTAAGNDRLTAVGRWVRRAGQQDLARLRAPWDSVAGWYRAPDEKTIRVVLDHLDPGALARDLPGPRPGGRRRRGARPACAYRARRAAQQGNAGPGPVKGRGRGRQDLPRGPPRRRHPGSPARRRRARRLFAGPPGGRRQAQRDQPLH